MMFYSEAVQSVPLYQLMDMVVKKKFGSYCVKEFALIAEYPLEKDFSLEDFSKHCHEKMNMCKYVMDTGGTIRFVFGRDLHIEHIDQLLFVVHLFQTALGDLHEKVEFEWRAIIDKGEEENE